MTFPRRRSWQGDRGRIHALESSVPVPCLCWTLLWALVPDDERGVVPALKELVF